MSDENGLKIIKLKASNFMNLEFVEIELDPDGNIVILYGKNGSGKTNILEVIKCGLSGKALSAAIEPVRRGQKSGEIVLDLGEIVIERKFNNDKTSSLVVENGDGMVYKSPQKLLDGFRGKISVDPMRFAGLPEKEQKKILLGLIDLPIDLDELDAKRKKIFSDRTLINRDVKNLEGQLSGITDMPDVPDDEKSTVEVMAEQKKAMELIASNKSVKENLQKEESEMEELGIKEDELKLELSRIQKLIDDKNELIPALKLDAEKLVDPDLEQFKCLIEDVENLNAKVRKKQERNRIQLQLTETIEISAGMSLDITAIDELKTKTILEANMPVPGLGFDEYGVTFEDIPLSQRSDGEKRKISMAIGMALNPNIKVMWITDASLLDKESMQEVKEMAEKHGFQIWLERVEPGDYKDVAIHIKEGRVIS